ncbi:MAG: hypothetical protein JNK87_34740 [Bryobacterales bacterium]|nr:hypothetical protein [Bryobacterales bacterium]
MMDLQRFILAQQEVLSVHSQRRYFREFVPSVDDLYRLSLSLDSPITLSKLMVQGHRAFLASAVIASQGQPDNADPITRRVIEMAQLAVAIHLDEKNYDRWQDEERRATRWKDRFAGKRPASSPPPKWGKEVLEHALLSELRSVLGFISDETAHFTPDYELSIGVNETVETDGTLRLELDYFQHDQAAIPPCQH